jgi:hypothetical protein
MKWCISGNGTFIVGHRAGTYMSIREGTDLVFLPGEKNLNIMGYILKQATDNDVGFAIKTLQSADCLLK